ncbi:MurR/RpiR family transcriptional regulator [Jeotgalibaca sp. MA1X17-3]|uniref:MurR/RpiR family transcriptional regulator n=1 Tax=Jeotgalibaca sp. MA1X17-3 TaxID=2908211 RepID=UPI001F23FE77|nr:MurR/RpiR family transcriptional regulator [Jeotgalibaca sp. MA1X17-3]UJF16610.1 MurR/RpiR family transcriptional regulator [Jeotgalibaca sp. MA1X17-3]
MLNRDLFLTIESSKLNFTEVDKLIADYFLSSEPPLKQSALAQKINVSTASITRFGKKIGFDNYKELLYSYRNHLKEFSNDTNNSTRHLQYRYKELINEIDNKINIQDVKSVCEYLHVHKNIHIFGLGMSAIAGADFKFRFTRIGKYVEVVQDESSMEMLSSLLGNENLIIYFSLRGENQHVLQSLKRLKEKGATIIIITSNLSREITQLANVSLATAYIENENEVGQISGQLPLIIVIDIIYSQYISMYRENINKWIATEHAYFHEHE